MNSKIKVPLLPESVADATVLVWHKQLGEHVVQDELLLELETDKVVLEVPAPVDGILSQVAVSVGSIVTGDQLLGVIDASVGKVPAVRLDKQAVIDSDEKIDSSQYPSPSVRKLLLEHDLSLDDIVGSGKQGRVLKQDVLAHIEPLNKKVSLDHSSDVKPAPVHISETSLQASTSPSDERVEQRVPMTRLRARIAERLLEAKQSTAMLTTFNEVNMQPLMDARQKYREMFEKLHGVRLGYMSLFVKSATIALLRFPEVNASIDGDNIVYHGYCDIGIAVSSERGLVVPMLRNTEHMTMSDIESQIMAYATKAKDGKLGLEELQGGTFTITNGGVFGSLLSTPILNPPQSAILGMHVIQKRAVVVQDEIVIRPMMYLALSYDHRIIDGKSAVSFLKTIKELVEDPSRILFEV